MSEKITVGELQRKEYITKEFKNFIDKIMHLATDVNCYIVKEEINDEYQYAAVYIECSHKEIGTKTSLVVSTDSAEPTYAAAFNRAQKQLLKLEEINKVEEEQPKVIGGRAAK